MMRYLNIIWIALLIAACQGGDQTVKEKKEQLRSFKKQKQQLSEKIKSLEKELGSIDSADFQGDQHTLVNVQELYPQTFRHFIDVHGSVEAKHNLRISPELSGRVVHIPVEEGDKVRKGEVLVELDKELIQKNIEEVKTSLDFARTVYQRQKNLWDQDIGSEVKYLEAKNKKETLEKKLSTLRTQLEKSTIKAPIDGTVDALFLEEGEMANPAQPMLRLINLSNLYVKADVSESHLGKITVGDTVQIVFPSVKQKQQEVVTHVGQVINANSRTFPVKVNLSKQFDVLRPNLLAVIKINDLTVDSALIVPAHIIQQDAKGNYLYTILTEGGKSRAEKTYVETGPTYEGRTVVLEGVKPGMQVVSEGFNELTSNERVAVKEIVNKKISRGSSSVDTGNGGQGAAGTSGQGMTK